MQQIRETCEFYVKDGIKQLEQQNVLIAGKYPTKDTINIVKSGVIFQQYCYDGLKYDVCVSWLQKSIRRGNIAHAIYCASQMIKLGRMFESHCLNRLLLIASEDIGASEVGIATRSWDLYNQIQSFRDTDRDRTKKLTTEFIVLLCNAKKNRLMDWMYHCTEMEPVRGAEELHSIVVEAKKEHMANRGYRFISNFTAKQQFCCKINAEITALKAIYNKRNDILALLHIVQLVYFKALIAEAGNTSTSTEPKSESEYLWDRYEYLNPVVLDDAIDTHTKDGAKLLKRDIIHFLCRGSLLSNWSKFPYEEEYMLKIYNSAITDLGYGRIKTDIVQRDYQLKIVQTIAKGYETKSIQTLEMACGAGKTKTSWWIAKETSGECFKNCRILVVTPLLGILTQFYESWRDMAITDKINMHAYILASKFSKPVGSAYTNYTHITDISAISDDMLDMSDEMPCISDGLKVVFTTYASEAKIAKSGMYFDFVIYDEAHHNKKIVSNVTYALRMSATLNGHADVTYSYADAILSGGMVDYKVRMMANDESVDDINDIMSISSKLIVYCVTNERSKELYNELNDACAEYSVYRLDCNTSAKDRLAIFRLFQNSSKKSVILNCRVLGEGVDLPECDSIYFDSGCTTYVTVIQAMGRCLRLSPGKKYGMIYMNAYDKNSARRMAEMFKVDPLIYKKCN